MQNLSLIQGLKFIFHQKKKKKMWSYPGFTGLSSLGETGLHGFYKMDCNGVDVVIVQCQAFLKILVAALI
jgi:hypothetical protein